MSKTTAISEKTYKNVLGNSFNRFMGIPQNGSLHPLPLWNIPGEEIDFFCLQKDFYTKTNSQLFSGVHFDTAQGEPCYLVLLSTLQWDAARRKSTFAASASLTRAFSSCKLSMVVSRL